MTTEKTKTVIYVGPYDAVDVTEVPGVVFEQGKEHDVPADVADRMLIQDGIWAVPGNAAARKKAHEKAVKDVDAAHAAFLAGEAKAADSEQPDDSSTTTSSSDTEGANS